MIKENVNSIQADLNLGVSRGFGQKDGHVAEEPGMSLGVHMEYIEDTLRMLRSDIALIMENHTPNSNIQTVSVENLSFSKNQQRKAKKVMMKSVYTIKATLYSPILKHRRVSGLAVEVMIKIMLVVWKTSISLLNGLMKRLKSISLTNL